MSVQALEALGHSEICQNLRLVGHAVLFGDFPDDPAGVARGEGAGRDVPGDHGPRADDAVTPGHTTTLAPSHTSLPMWTGLA